MPVASDIPSSIYYNRKTVSDQPLAAKKVTLFGKKTAEKRGLGPV